MKIKNLGFRFVRLKGCDYGGWNYYGCRGVLGGLFEYCFEFVDVFFGDECDWYVDDWIDFFVFFEFYEGFNGSFVFVGWVLLDDVGDLVFIDVFDCLGG